MPTTPLSAGNDKFVLKEVPHGSFSYYQKLYKRLSGCNHLRIACDSVPDHAIFVYKYLSDHLLSFALGNPELPTIKRILKDTLRGIAAMHDQDIVHTGTLYSARSRYHSNVTPDACCLLILYDVHVDIKPNNIFIQLQDTDVEEVRLADLEDSAHVPPETAIIGKQMGNWMWRSPEAHAEGPINKPSDLFSFGLVVSVSRQSVPLLTGVVLIPHADQSFKRY